MIKNIIVSIVLVSPNTDNDSESPLLDSIIVVMVDGTPIYRININMNYAVS
jgi:hypothetical protein